MCCYLCDMLIVCCDWRFVRFVTLRESTRRVWLLIFFNLLGVLFVVILVLVCF